MGYRALRRALVVTAAVGLLSTGAAFADIVRTDGDTVDPELDGLVELGDVAPGAVLVLEVGFELQCSGFAHVNANQSVVLTPGARSIPPGAGADYGGTTIAPPGAGWPLDGDMCASTVQPVRAAGTAAVTLTAPLEADENYIYTLGWNRSLDPVATGDFGTFSGITAVTFTLNVVSTVVDTTDPVLAGMPGDLTLATSDPAGAPLVYTLPTATDDVDPAPVVSCSPAPGDVAPVGESVVTCTATDGSGNQASADFGVTVALWTTLWDEPIGSGASITANAGRTVPVKVRLFVDGAEVTAGSPYLHATRCDGTGAALDVPLSWGSGNGRWNGLLDTGLLGGTGCYLVSGVMGDLTVSSFTVDVVGSVTPAKARGPGG
jgi:hypothetical protein